MGVSYAHIEFLFSKEPTDSWVDGAIASHEDGYMDDFRMAVREELSRSEKTVDDLIDELTERMDQLLTIYGHEPLNKNNRSALDPFEGTPIKPDALLGEPALRHWLRKMQATQAGRVFPQTEPEHDIEHALFRAIEEQGREMAEIIEGLQNALPNIMSEWQGVFVRMGYLSKDQPWDYGFITGFNYPSKGLLAPFDRIVPVIDNTLAVAEILCQVKCDSSKGLDMTSYPARFYNHLKEILTVKVDAMYRMGTSEAKLACCSPATFEQMLEVSCANVKDEKRDEVVATHTREYLRIMP